MSEGKPYVLTIAGFDPSAGAGLLADIKTFQMHGVYGLGVCTALTYQNENEFVGLKWVDFDSIEKQIDILFKKYSIPVVKIGLIESLPVLSSVIVVLEKLNPSIKIIWDPILKASAGFDFHEQVDQSMLKKVLPKLFLVTPNVPEALQLFPSENSVVSAELMSQYCNVYLKGGHGESESADDLLITSEKRFDIHAKRIEGGEKHGSGCVLSSSIASNLALGKSLAESCVAAKNYMNGFLKSNPSLLGYHHLVN